MNIKIRSVNDRITVAGILIKNGYSVSQYKEKKEGSKSYEYGLLVTEPKDMVISTREDD